MRIQPVIALALFVISREVSAQCVQAPNITTSPASSAVCPDTPAIFTAAATGNPSPTVQWQVSTNAGVSFATIPGATTTQLVLTADSPIPVTGPVFIILMENQNWSSIRGSANAPYINNVLLPMAARAEQYYNPPALHPSEPNYIWLEAGTNLGVTNDNDPSSNHQSTPNHLVTLLKNAGVPWRTYQEDITGTTCPITSSGNYAAKHNPMVFFDDVTCVNNSACAYCIANMRPFTQLAGDLASNTVARYNFITPNLCDDMHNSCAPLNNGIKQGDAWLSNNIPAILSSASYSNNGAIFITWDEGAGTSDGPIGMIVLSPVIKAAGYTNTIHYTHSSTLRTMQEILGVSPFLGDAINATDLSDLFKPASSSMNGFQYRAIFNNGCGGVTSSVATLTVNALPSMTAQPANQTVCPGGAASFSVNATGAGPLAYQWRKPGWSSGWDLRTSGSGFGGFYVGTSTGNDGTDLGNDGDINTSGKAWGMYANGGFLANPVRRLGAPMSVGQTFKIDMDNGYVNSATDNGGSIGAGSVGFGLRDAGETNRFEFYFTGGDTQYRINDSSSSARGTGIAFTGAGLHLEFTLTGVNTYSLTISAIGINGASGLPLTFTGTLTGTAGTAIDRLRLFNYSAGSGSQRDAFFNNINIGNQFDNAADSAYATGWTNGMNGGYINVAGATNTTLVINPVSPSDAGKYNVLVTGACGPGAVSSNATLSLNPVCISIAAPPDLSYVTSMPVVVTGTASSTSTVSSVTVNGFAASTGNLYSNWTASVSGLAGGTNTLTAIATDSLAHSATNTSRVVYADATFDGNGDGIPDWWQIKYFGDPNSPNAAPGADSDGDGASNLQEYLAGTDPTDVASFLRVTRTAVDGGGFTVEWNSVPGKTYRVQYRDDWTAGWSDLPSDVTAATTTTNKIDASAVGLPARFYRVIIP